MQAIIEEFLKKNNLEFFFIDKVNSTYLYISKDEKKLFKIKQYESSTKTLKEEYNAISFLQKYDFVPRIFNYFLIDAVLNIEGIVLEYIEGFHLSKDNYFPNAEIDLLKCLSKIYSDGIQHGDIKPENILVKDKKIYLIDFNQVKISTSQELHKKYPNFWICEDIIGNIYCQELQMNYKKLKEHIEKWKR